MGDYRAPLFLAWQVTNACGARCLHCCEESGPDRAWPSELGSAAALSLARQTVELDLAEVAFGGGEPLGYAPIWDVFDILRAGSVAIKIETNGLLIDDRAADRLAALEVETVQISLDGARASTHERVRPGSSFQGAVDSVRRLAARGLEPEVVFVPTRWNFAEAAETFDLAASLGARKFVTGPMMRLGRAATAWESLAPSAAEWSACAAALEERGRARPGSLAMYPWDIVGELRARLDRPQAMLLVVPDGKVKLLNALPFYCSDLAKATLAEAWDAYQAAWRDPGVRDFIARALRDPALLRHANECWPVGPVSVGPGR